MQITFNTKRLYTKEGQVITARLYEKGLVDFYDQSRLIAGQFGTDFVIGAVREITLIRSVMTHYDNNDYLSICPPRGLTRGEVVIDHRC